MNGIIANCFVIHDPPASFLREVRPLIQFTPCVCRVTLYNDYDDDEVEMKYDWTPKRSNFSHTARLNIL